MKNIKKSITVFGAIAITILMVSTATAVEHANSEPVMNYIDREEKTENLMNQLETTISSVKIKSSQDVEYTVEDFVNFILSDEFIDFMKSPKITDFINGDLFLEFYNTPEVQAFIQSNEFNNFTKCSIACCFLKKYKNRGDQSLAESIDVNNQYILSESQSVNSAVGMNSNIQTTTQIDTNEEASSSMTTIVAGGQIEESMSSTSQNIGYIANPSDIPDILLLVAYLLIGFITWPVAIEVFGFEAPLWGAYFGFMTAGLVAELGAPLWEIIVCAVGAAFLVTLYCIWAAVWWPLVWGYVAAHWFGSSDQDIVYGTVIPEGYQAVNQVASSPQPLQLQLVKTLASLPTSR